MGPTSSGPRAPSLDQVLADFLEVKVGIGLTPAKMSEARAVLAVLGEPHATRAAQRLLDDLADLSGDDGAALAIALRADPHRDRGQTLAARRRGSGVPVNTAKDREKRAVEKLYSKWTAVRQDWAAAVHSSRFTSLPANASVRFGSIKVEISVFWDDSRGFPAVALATENITAASDFLTVAANSNGALAVYGMAGAPWRLELWLPPFSDETVLVHRSYETQPTRVTIDITEPDGRSRLETIPGEKLRSGTLLSLPVASLDPPCPIAWWWRDPPDEYRPTIDFS